MRSGAGAAHARLTQWAGILTFIVLAIAAILYLPYFVPLTPTASYSYLFGYNNRAGVALLVLASALAAWWWRKEPWARATAIESVEAPAVPLSLVWLASGLVLAFTVGLDLLVGGIGGLHESGYGVHRVWLLSQGLRPYRDFEWPFGVAMLYLPLWTARLLHVSVAQGYYLTWIAAAVASVPLLRAVVNRSPTSAHRSSVFLLLLLPMTCFLVSMGIHYTGIRYLPLLYFTQLLHEQSQRVGRGVSTGALTVGFCAVLLLISPEIAIAFCSGAVVLLYPQNRFSRSQIGWPSYLATLVGLAVALLIARHVQEFGTMAASSGGADSLPITFSPITLFFFFVVGFGFRVVVQRWVNPAPSDNRPALLIVALPLLAAALGRCDVVHIFFNGLAFLLVALLYAARSRHWKLVALAFVLVFLLSPAIGALQTVGVDVGFAAMQAETRDALPGHRPGKLTRISEYLLAYVPSASFRNKQQRRMALARQYPLTDHLDFAALYPGAVSRGEVFEAPYGYNPSQSAALYLSPQVDHGFYKAMENANTRSAIARKIQELQSHPDRPLLLDEGFEKQSDFVDVPAAVSFMGHINLFPYRARAVHPERLDLPLQNYIESHYVLAQAATAANFHFELWLPKQPTAK